MLLLWCRAETDTKTKHRKLTEEEHSITTPARDQICDPQLTSPALYLWPVSPPPKVTGGGGGGGGFSSLAGFGKNVDYSFPTCVGFFFKWRLAREH